MLKVLQRQTGQHKLTHSEIPSSPAGSSFSRQQRPHSMRLPSSAPFTAQTPANNTKNLSKYVSCQNLASPAPASFNRSGVIYEEDAESTYNDARLPQMKDTFKKRYNSLTNLLMSSFRKAKGRKKQSQFYEDDEIPVDSFKRIDPASTLTRRNSLFSSASKPPAYRPAPAQSRLSLCESPEALPDTIRDAKEGEGSGSEGEEEDASTPVFLGVRRISDDFVQAPAVKPAPPVQAQQREKRIYDKQSELVYQTYVKLKEQNPSIYSSIVSVNQNPAGRAQKLRQASGSVEQSVYSSIVSLNEASAARGGGAKLVPDKSEAKDFIGQFPSHSKRQVSNSFSSHECTVCKQTEINKFRYSVSLSGNKAS
jgi:hypothetical protein